MVAPVFQHPDGKELVPFDDRINMCWDLVQPIQPAHCPVWVDRIERQAWAQGGQGYTSNTLQLVLNMFKPEAVVLIVGSDIYPENWAGYEDIEMLMNAGRVEIFRVHRAAESVNSSTNARERIRRGLSTSFLVPARIRQTIDKNGWYK